MRNPDWARDELILALALYFRSGRKQLDATHADVIALSSVLNALGVHEGQLRGEAFRNPNGVAMKLGNFSAIDPANSGVGLSRGGKLEKVVWDEFATAPETLYSTAEAIRHLGEPGKSREPIRSWDPDGAEEEFAEGKLLTRLHIARERNSSVVKKKKAAVLQETGKLACECCGFDFAAEYGKLGWAFAECHHRVPLAKLREGARTKQSDLSIVCANCHRMIHRSGNELSIDALRQLISGQRALGA